MSSNTAPPMFLRDFPSFCRITLNQDTSQQILACSKHI